VTLCKAVPGADNYNSMSDWLLRYANKSIGLTDGRDDMSPALAQ